MLARRYVLLAAILRGRNTKGQPAKPEKGKRTLLDVVRDLPTDKPFLVRPACGKGVPQNVTSMLKKFELIRRGGRADTSHPGHLWTITDKTRGLLAYLKELEQEEEDRKC